jgi:ketosteroid isomerase-like protein
MSERPPEVVDIAHRLFTSTSLRDWEEFAELIHPDAEIALRSETGRIIHGRAEMEEFARSVISARRAHEITVDVIEQLADDAVVALGRLFISDARGVTDAPVGWLMLFEDGMLRRSLLVDSVPAARDLLEQFQESDLPV